MFYVNIWMRPDGSQFYGRLWPSSDLAKVKQAASRSYHTRGVTFLMCVRVRLKKPVNWPAHARSRRDALWAKEGL